MKKIALLITSMILFSDVSAENLKINPVKIDQIYVNGGEDSPNSGTTCFTIDLVDSSDELSESCVSGFIAVKNNNNQLLSALLTIKATNREAWVYYSDEQPEEHCPGKVYTACVLNSISMK